MEPLHHSVSVVRLMSTPELAEMALQADDTLRELRSSLAEEDDLADARNDRRIALEELVRRGEIESYSFI